MEFLGVGSGKRCGPDPRILAATFPSFTAGCERFNAGPVNAGLAVSLRLASFLSCINTLMKQLFRMAETTQTSVLQLAERLSEGFTALSEEYQLLLDQQRQLESKLSSAKHQVRPISAFPFIFMMNPFSSRPAVALRL